MTVGVVRLADEAELPPTEIGGEGKSGKGANSCISASSRSRRVGINSPCAVTNRLCGGTNRAGLELAETNLISGSLAMVKQCRVLCD